MFFDFYFRLSKKISASLGVITNKNIDTLIEL